MCKDFESVKDQLITEFTKTIELFGLTTLESRLFAYLYLTNEPRTLDEMSEALGKSKTAMSTNVRSLADLNLVTQVWKKSVRKDLYKAEPQLFKMFINFYMRKWIDSTGRQKEALLDIKKECDREWGTAEDYNKGKELLNKLNEIIDFHHELESAFNDLRKGQIR